MKIHISKSKNTQTYIQLNFSTKVKTPGGTITNSAGVNALRTNLRLCD